MVTSAAGVESEAPDSVHLGKVGYGIEGPHTLGEGYYLGAIEGRVRWAKTGGGRVDWELVRAREGLLLRVSESERYKYHGWYLSYDPTGRDKGVFLSEKPGKGSYWELGKGPAERRSPFTRTLRAATGKAAGWYLAVGGKAERGKDLEGNPFTAYKAVLSPDPKPVPRFNLVEIAP